MDSTVSWPRRIGRMIRKVVLFAVVLCVVGYVVLSIVIAHILTRPNNRPNGFDPKQISPAITRWSTTTADGLTIRGWYAPTPASRRLIVLVHGLGGSLDEMSEIGRDLHARGFGVLVFDLRGHGQSDPSRLYLGSRERGDVRAVLEWATKQGFTPDRIGWLGHSMGGATLIMEGERNPQIQALVIDSAYGNLPKLLDRQLSDSSGLPRWFNPGILLAARLFFGVRTDNLMPVQSIRNWGDRPLFLIHGERDSIVPIGQAHEIIATAGPKCETMILPDVEHVGAYHADPQRYIDAVGGFFDRNLAR